MAESPDGNELVCVSFTSQDHLKEQVVVCEKGEHAFIEHTTVVAYNFARRFAKKTVQSYLDGGTFKKKAPCSAALLQKVCAGMNQSERIPKHVLKAFNDATGH